MPRENSQGITSLWKDCLSSLETVYNHVTKNKASWVLHPSRKPCTSWLVAIKDHTYPQNRSSARLYDPSLPKRLPDLFKVAPVGHFLIHHLNIQGTVEDAKRIEMPSTSWSQRDKTVSQIFPYSFLFATPSILSCQFLSI